MQLSQQELEYLYCHLLPQTGLKEFDEDVCDLVYQAGIERLLTLTERDERVFLNELLTKLAAYLDIAAIETSI